jgi:hypothetical protein
MLVIGLATVAMSSRWTLAVVGVLFSVLSGLLFAATRHMVDNKQPINPANILGVEPLVRRLGGVSTLPLVLIGVGAALLLTAVARLSLPAGLVALGLVFALSAVDTQARFVDPGANAKALQTVLVGAVNAASAQLGVARQCVAYDNPEDFNFFSDRLLLGTQPVSLLTAGRPPCGPFVVSGESPAAFAHLYAGARLVIEENDVGESLYVLPGPVLARLQAAGWLLPSAMPGPIPLGGQVARLQASSVVARVRASSVGSREVVVTNAGAVSPWPSSHGLGQAEYAVRLAERWYLGAGTAVVAKRAVDLPRSLLPGEHASVSVPLRAPAEPGEYRVTLTLYQEGHGDLGPPITLSVQVT